MSLAKKEEASHKVSQTGFTIVAPINEVEKLNEALKAIHADPARNLTLPFATEVDLHFCSLSIIHHKDRPHLVFEGNIDGEVRPFLESMIKKNHKGLDIIFECCKGYDKNNRLPSLLKLDQGPGCLYIGCPGRSVAQIRDEQALRDSLEGEIKRLQASGSTVTTEELKDFSRKRSRFSPYSRPFLVQQGQNVLIVSAGLIIVALVTLLFIAPLPTLVTILGVVALFLLGWMWLRHLEATDKINEAAPYAKTVPTVVEYEDFGISNHYASASTVKSGWFRLLLLRVVLTGVQLIAKLIANKGSLGGIPSIHFARWVIYDKTTLIFLSNYDGSWEAYLNDFIDRAAVGLTAIWSNTLTFPRTENLIHEGATHEIAFKVFGRNIQVPTLVWYRAYPELSTINIENNTKLREGITGYDVSEGDERWLARL